MSSRSRCSRRGGFTLLEVTIALGIGLVVSGAALYAYVGANKAESTAVSSNMLKASGEAALAELYRKLNQSRHIFDRGAEADSYLQLLPIAPYQATGLTPAILAADLVVPKIDAGGSLQARLDDGSGVPGGQALPSDNPNFDATAVGNCLFFLTKDVPAVIKEATAGVQNAAFGTQSFRIRTYRFQLYWLARRPLGLNAQPIRGGSAYTYQLMHWDSLPYLDRKDLEDWMTGVATTANDNGTSHAFIYGTPATSKLNLLAAKYPGALDLNATTATDAFYGLSTTDFRTLPKLNPAPTMVSGHFATALKSNMKSSFGETFVAFNTEIDNAASTPAVPIQALAQAGARVPSYALANATPYGFETMVVGPANRRKILARLTLAARTTPGNTLVAQAFQQVIQAYDF